MKLDGTRKETMKKAETKEQAKEIIANAAMELTNEEVEQVSGGCGEAEQRSALDNVENIVRKSDLAQTKNQLASPLLSSKEII